MKPAAFAYLRPASVPEALQALSRHGAAAKLLAGGQSLVPMMNLRLVKPEVLIDIGRIPELQGIALEGGELVIGAMVRHASLLESDLVARHCPLMAEAYPWVAHGPIRNRGTLGGNLAHADPASEMPAVLAACEGRLDVAGPGGRRTLAAAEFFTGALATALGEGEMLTAVRIPAAPAGQGWAWEEVANRRGDFAMAGVGALVHLAGGRATQVRLAVAGMQSPAVRLAAVEQALVGSALDAAAIVQAGRAAREAVQPGDSYHADALYKRELVDTLVQRALQAARARAR